MSFAVFISTLHVQEKKKENSSKLFYFQAMKNSNMSCFYCLHYQLSNQIYL
jgi:hypothetical protein